MLRATNTYYLTASVVWESKCTSASASDYVGLVFNNWSQGVSGDCCHPFTGIGVLGFPKIKGREETQEEFPDEFYRVSCSAQGRQHRREQGLPDRLGGWVCLAVCISRGQSKLAGKGGLPSPAVLLGNYVHTCTVGQDSRLVTTITPGSLTVVKPRSTDCP